MASADNDNPPPTPPRVVEAQRLITRHSYAEVRDELVRQFGICARTAERDIAHAYRLLAADAEEERPFLRARELDRLHRLARAAEMQGDYAAAIRASAQIAKLTGLEAPTELAIGISREQQALLNAVQMTPYERRRREAELQLAAEDDAEAEVGADEPS